jgi:hypothetical protein
MRTVVVSGFLLVSGAVIWPMTASAAPSGNTQGCTSLFAQYNAGNPGVTKAANTPFGYGACGFGTPGGPR